MTLFKHICKSVADRSSSSTYSSSFIHYAFRSRHAHPSHRSHRPALSTFKTAGWRTRYYTGGSKSDLPPAPLCTITFHDDLRP
ncbi:uncharacterized protein ARMOST_17635 [Armillaria ostoyae]|uniref:Uncharacterized protein n=1 Tax=Armillaria ostoyae TaxID=47428 RepID=A0A284RZL9_ARMOS|nr:uncharacterized protein ARMOST_17635 [Armillaria ostoyae]